MKVGKGVTDSELPRLQQLASELAAAASPEVSLLDQIASLAVAVAARWREDHHRQLLDQVVEQTQALFPAAPTALRSHLAQSTADELSGLDDLLNRAIASSRAFEQADSGLMAARDRGDYAAMAPLAIEADAHKRTGDTARTEFSIRLGLGDLSAEAAPPAGEAAPDGEVVQPEVAVEPAYIPPIAAVADAEMLAAPASGPIEFEERIESQPERRRLRALIRQMRPVTEEE